MSKERLAPVFAYIEFCLKQVVANNELPGIMELLNGQFLVPAPDGDPIRNPDVLPSGRNMHALDLDPSSIPTTAAVEVAKDVVRKLLEKLADENNGAYLASQLLVGLARIVAVLRAHGCATRNIPCMRSCRRRRS